MILNCLLFYKQIIVSCRKGYMIYNLYDYQIQIGTEATPLSIVVEIFWSFQRKLILINTPKYRSWLKKVEWHQQVFVTYLY